MPVVKNRTVIELANNISAFLQFDLGLVRGVFPDYARLFKRAEERLAKQNQQITKQNQQISQMRDQLSEQNERIATLRALLDIELGEDLYNRDLHLELTELLEDIPADMGGGSSLSKVYVMALLIRKHDLKNTVDIGVYRGRSLFPQALVHGKYTGGVVYGVDPWSVEEAKEQDLDFMSSKRKEKVEQFIEQTDWGQIYREVKDRKESFRYGENCVLLRKTSSEAIDYFEEKDITFDLVHIDGNHDTEKVMQDIELYPRRLREGGFIVLDDISFGSVEPAYAELKRRMQLVFERVDQPGSNNYAIFCNVTPSSIPESVHNRRFWVKDFTQYGPNAAPQKQHKDRDKDNTATRG